MNFNKIRYFAFILLSAAVLLGTFSSTACSSAPDFAPAPSPEEIARQPAESFIKAEAHSLFTIVPQRQQYAVSWTITNTGPIPVKITYRTSRFRAINDHSIATGETRGTGIHVELQPGERHTVNARIRKIDNIFFDRLRGAGGEVEKGLIYQENIYFTVKGIGKRLSVSSPVEVAPRPETK